MYVKIYQDGKDQPTGIAHMSAGIGLMILDGREYTVYVSMTEIVK